MIDWWGDNGGKTGYIVCGERGCRGHCLCVGGLRVGVLYFDKGRFDKDVAIDVLSDGFFFSLNKVFLMDDGNIAIYFIHFGCKDK